MPGAAELPADLPAEFTGPLGLSAWWPWLAALGLALVALYYVTVLLLVRPRPAPTTGAAAPPGLHERYLDLIDGLVAAVHGHEITARDGHQQLSGLVRGYVEESSGLPATRMSLADFHSRAPHLVAAISLMYPPEFAPDDDGEAHERFDRAVSAARTVVTR